MTAIIITGIICGTLIIILGVAAWIGNRVGPPTHIPPMRPTDTDGFRRP